MKTTITAQIQCCGNWIGYPAPGNDTTCPACRSVFSVTPAPAHGIPSPMWTREHEFLVRITSQFAGVCSIDGKPLMAGQFAWDHRISSGPSYDGRPWKFGEDPFPCVRHADGTECAAGLSSFTQPRCPECHQYNSLNVAQEAYGDRTTCRTPRCTYTSYYSIGD
jgi:hypothetical protein